MGRSASWLYLFLLLMLAGITFWLEQTVRDAGPSWNAAHRHAVDFDISGFSATSFNTGGQPSQSLAAAQLLHYPDNDLTLLQRPVYTRIDGADHTVNITADRGQSRQAGNDLWFIGNVVVTWYPVTGQPPRVAHTQRLHLLPKSHLVQTNLPVTLQDSGNIIQAGGMTLDTATRQAQLRGPVRATYQAAAAAPQRVPGRRGHR